MDGVVWCETYCVTRFDGPLCARAGLIGLLETIARGDSLDELS